MSQYETYLLLFTDVLVSNFAISSTSEIVFDALQIFGGHNQGFIVSVAMSAYMCSICLNYLFGIVCYKILAPINKDEAELTTKISSINKFLPLLLVLSCLPFFGKFVVLLSGFCRTKFRLVFIISLLAKLGYYIYATIPLF